MENETEEKKPAEIKKKEERDAFLAKTEELVGKLEKTKAEIQELVERNEDLAARKLLSGRSDEAQPVPVKPETPREYAARISRGQLKPGELK